MWGKTQDFLESLVGFDMKAVAVILNAFRVHLERKLCQILPSVDELYGYIFKREE